MNYKEKLFNELLNIGGLCERINLFEFEDLLDNGLLDCLTDLEQHILKSRLVKENSLIYIAYEIGYSSSSSVATKIKRSLHKLIKETNKRMTHIKDDPISYIVGNSIIKKSGIIDGSNMTIDRYMCMCDTWPKNITKADVYIILRVLKSGLKFKANMKVMADISNHDIMVLDAYNLLINDKFIEQISLEENSFETHFIEYAFVNNFEKALELVYRDDKKLISIILALIPYSSKMDVRNVSKKLFSKYFLKVVYEPKCLYTDVYFQNAESKDIEIDSLITLPDSVIEILNDYSKGVHGPIKLYDLASWVYTDSSTLVDIVGDCNTCMIVCTINYITEANDKIASEFHDICKK